MGLFIESVVSRFPALGVVRSSRGERGGKILPEHVSLESSFEEEVAPQFVPVEGVHYLPRIDGLGHKFTTEGRKIAKDYWKEYEKGGVGENYTNWLAARMEEDQFSNNQGWVALMHGSFARRLRAQEVKEFLESEKNGVTWGKVIMGPGGSNYVNAMRAMRAESQIKMVLEKKNLEDEKTVETRAMGLMALALVEVLAGENPKTAWRETVELSSALEIVGVAEREIKAEQDSGNLNNYGGVKLGEVSETVGLSPGGPLDINNGVLEERQDSSTVEIIGGIIPAQDQLLEGRMKGGEEIGLAEHSIQGEPDIPVHGEGGKTVHDGVPQLMTPDELLKAKVHELGFGIPVSAENRLTGSSVEVLGGVSVQAENQGRVTMFSDGLDDEEKKRRWNEWYEMAREKREKERDSSNLGDHEEGEVVETDPESLSEYAKAYKELDRIERKLRKKKRGANNEETDQRRRIIESTQAYTLGQQMLADFNDGVAMPMRRSLGLVGSGMVGLLHKVQFQAEELFRKKEVRGMIIVGTGLIAAGLMYWVATQGQQQVLRGDFEGVYARLMTRGN
jgi:hypothetical protein